MSTTSLLQLNKSVKVFNENKRRANSVLNAVADIRKEAGKCGQKWRNGEINLPVLCMNEHVLYGQSLRPTSRQRSRLLLTRSSADADKPARRVYRSVKVTKHSTIPYVRYSFLLCNSNFVFKFFTIFDFKKCHDLEIGARGHSGSLTVAPFDRMCMVSY